VGEEGGRFTGVYVRPACYGAGKVTRAESFAVEHGIDLRQSYFYSDSYSDLPMLERVGQPRVVNPDPRLRRAAQRRGWSAESWRAPRLAIGEASPPGGSEGSEGSEGRSSHVERGSG
jgi:phosphoserine phosphatase